MTHLPNRICFAGVGVAMVKSKIITGKTIFTGVAVELDCHATQKENISKVGYSRSMYHF